MSRLHIATLPWRAKQSFTTSSTCSRTSICRGAASNRGEAGAPFQWARHHTGTDTLAALPQPAPWAGSLPADGTGAIQARGQPAHGTGATQVSLLGSLPRHIPLPSPHLHRRRGAGCLLSLRRCSAAGRAHDAKQGVHHSVVHERVVGEAAASVVAEEGQRGRAV